MGMIINPYRFASPLLLDTYTGATAAYSLRKLRTAYTGYCIRVRRSSDNAEQDIGFTAGNVLDESALTTFVRANDGFVTTWYDQSGNGNNISQDTTTRQLSIVSSGSVITGYNSKPALNSNVSGFDSLPKANWKFLHTLQATISFVFDYNSAGGLYYIVNTDAGYNVLTRVGVAITYQGFTVGNASGTGCVITHSSSYPKGHILWDYDCTDENAATRSKCSINGSDLSDNTYNESPSSGDSFANLMICARRDGENGVVGKWQEIIIWDSRKSSDRSGIKSNVNSFYSIY